MLRLGVCATCEAAAEEMSRRLQEKFPGLAGSGEFTIEVQDERGARWIVTLWVDVHAHCEPVAEPSDD